MSEEATVEAGEETTEQAGETTETTETQESTQETTQEATQETTQEATDWRSGIEDEKLSKFAEKFTDPKDALKTAFEFRQKLSNAVVLPGKNASEEDIKEFHKRLGVPDSPDGYKIDYPEDESLKEELSMIVERMHAKGATPEAVQAAVEARKESVEKGQEAYLESLEQSRIQAEEALKKDWGNDYDKNAKYAQRGAVQFGGDEFKEFLEKAEVDGVPLGNHPQFLKVFSAIGRKMGEGGLHMALDEDEKQSMSSEIDTLTEQAHAAMEKGNRSEANKLFAKRDELSKSFYGSE